ncbi:glutamate--tRNA ligase [Yoonia sediminilitoris]|uniref:Glutamate--tRNA ligase n=1 Tax=Yoonia sediminilitoris TaxID=1286148 RepID=A0A2T6KFW3_9RHOB|nr:glutamate--tRNA ligase [Yoonia sediminilitoris]PUB14201.1 glutamyl-tRNA synthetase [Yoonia sediminilitoris]RCW95132.1 glutamyl-tRNA synthetase [Yoonia sediminilitoris]
MTTTRFAPSPTGWLHIGNLRAALFNYAIARQNGGTFILRIDDTDQERSKDEYIQGIKDDLTWLGMDWDRVEHQSKRFDRYQAAKQRLIDMGRLYECFETPVELDLKRKKQLNMGKPPVYDRAALSLSDEEKDKLRAERGSHWRFKLDQERIEWTDGIIGDISIDAASVSDPVLFKNDGQILYTLASVVDDTEMGITDVVRGSDHVTNTATQIQMIMALGGTVPRFAHHSLLTGPQGEALSKRLGTLALRDLRKSGIAPQAILSLMARLGSSDPVELRTDIRDVVDNFDISKFGSAPTKFDAEDLKPLTARYLGTLSHQDVADVLTSAGVPDALHEPFWEVVRDNIGTLDDVAGWWALFRDGATPLVAEEDKDFIAKALFLLDNPPYNPDTWAHWTQLVKEETGRKGKALFMPLRKAVTGLERGPEMADVMPLLQTKPRV